MSKKLHIGNLPFNVTQAQIRALFSEAGEITEINLITDRYTGTPKGFGFIEMATDEGAAEAVKRFNGYTLDSRNLTVAEAHTREPRVKDGITTP